MYQCMRRYKMFIVSFWMSEKVKKPKYVFISEVKGVFLKYSGILHSYRS